MDIRQVDISQITNRMRKRDYDIMPRLWRAMPWPSSDLANLLVIGIHQLLLQLAWGGKPGD
ncbi:hypothetical protein ACLK1Y_12175 [Escherichia coli]